MVFTYPIVSARVGHLRTSTIKQILRETATHPATVAVTMWTVVLVVMVVRVWWVLGWQRH